MLCCCYLCCYYLCCYPLCCCYLGCGSLVGPTPWSARSLMRNPPSSANYPNMPLYQRRLPHDYETDHPVFLTWRLHGSLPSHRDFPTQALNSGQAFAAMDRLLDEACTGSFYLRQPAIADMIVEAIHYNADILRHYILHAFVVMPNHVHLLATPSIALPKLTRSLKGITGKRANAMLTMTGSRLWQEESYDHAVRSEPEFEKIRNYIEENPVRAGLVKQPGDYRRSSAACATGASLRKP